MFRRDDSYSIVPGSILGVLVLLSGCVGPATESEETVVPMTLLIAGVSKPWPTVGVPNDLESVMLPFKSDVCKTTSFLPEVTLVRPSVERRVLIPAKEVSWRSFLRDLYGAHIGFEQRRHESQERLRGLSVPPELTLEFRAEAEVLQQLIHTDPAVGVFAISDGAVSVPLPAQKTLVATGDADAVVKAMGGGLCKDRETGQRRSPRLVLYGLTSQLQTALPPPSRNPPECRKLYGELTTLTRRPDLSDRKELDERLKEARLTCPHDYRFPYERAILAAEYGRAQHVAFALLVEAAERAIANGDSERMLKAMLDHGRADSFLHRLTSHHEWPLLVKALEKTDKSLLEGLVKRHEGKVSQLEGHESGHREAPGPAPPPSSGMVTCNTPATPFLGLRLSASDVFAVRITRDAFRFKANEQYYVPVGDFRRFFSEVIDSGCRFPAELTVADGISREDVQRARDVLKSAFDPAGVAG